MSLWTCHLNPRSPRYKEWHRILESDEVPLLDAKTYHATFGKEEHDVEIHKLDIQALTPAQMRRLVNFVCAKYQVWANIARVELETTGFPIRAEDVILAFSLRAMM